MPDDGQLLQQYVDEHSEDAFTELVRRHLGIVYFAALRRVGGDSHLAHDVAQKVFTDLARKASSLKNRPTLTGWLYTSTRFAAAQTVRTESRRRHYEQEAEAMRTIAADQDPNWTQLSPIIDEAMDALSAQDREAVLLRFFENLSFAEIGTKFSLSPDATRMRIDRALEKLRKLLAKRGVASTSPALATVLFSQSGIAAPAGLVAKISTIAVGQSAVAATSSLALWKIISAAAVVGMSATVIIYSQRKSQAVPSTTEVSLANTTPGPSDSPRLSANAWPLPNPSIPPKADHSFQNTHASPKKHRSTEEFGWPVIGLFASDPHEGFKRTITEFRAKLEQDPDFRAAVLAQAKDRLDLFYGPLFRTLHLSDESLDRFKDLLVQKQCLRIETAEAQNTIGLPVRSHATLHREAIDQAQESVDKEIKQVLGDPAYIQYLQYREDLVPWVVANAVIQKVQDTPNPLSDEQSAKLVGLLRRSLLKTQSVHSFDLAFGAGLFPAHLGSRLTEKILQQAGNFLLPPQVEALRSLQKPEKLLVKPGTRLTK